MERSFAKMEQILRDQGVSEVLLTDLEEFRREHHGKEGNATDRIAPPQFPYFGKEVFEMAAFALLEGENILLCGGKATGKNILAENLAWMFGRPMYDISFHVNMDSSALIGTDTFRDNEVCFRPGLVYETAVNGGFGILDEINMAKNDAVSVLHAVLDDRRVLDVPGYSRIHLDLATRFIGTMNYGYAGTRELNEALVSRFLVVSMPEPGEEDLLQILGTHFPDLKEEGKKQLAGLFLDLALKASHSEISTKALDLRGMVGAIRLIRRGLAPRRAIAMGISDKCFDPFEQELVSDVIMTRIPQKWDRSHFF